MVLGLAGGLTAGLVALPRVERAAASPALAPSSLRLVLVHGAPAKADDPGVAIEKQFGVVGRDSAEGRRLNDLLAEVTGRITGAFDYKLKSAKLLGGADAQRDKVVNAFALPDGRIYVTLGLARAVEKASEPDAELAFVVGHEVAHVVKKHGEARQGQAVGAGLAALVIGVATGSRVAGTLANAGATAYVSHFSRTDEYEADREGLRAMHRAGYPLEAAVSMLQRLQKVGGGSGGGPDPKLNSWFGTHPMTGQRVNKVQALIAKIQGQGTAATAR
jgi:predicted Zn-dependent protease